MQKCINAMLLGAMVSVPLSCVAAIPLNMKDQGAKKLHGAIGKEVQRIFLDKKGGVFKKSLVKNPLTRQELAAWNSLSNNIMNYEKQAGFALGLPGNEGASKRKAMLGKIQTLNSDLLDALVRINTIYNLSSKERQKMTKEEMQKVRTQEIPFLKDERGALVHIYDELLNYGFPGVEKSESQIMTDAALVLSRYVSALQDICDLIIKQLQEK
jgi:hypothetical protein